MELFCCPRSQRGTNLLWWCFSSRIAVRKPGIVSQWGLHDWNCNCYVLSAFYSGSQSILRLSDLARWYTRIYSVRSTSLLHGTRARFSDACGSPLHNPCSYSLELCMHAGNSWLLRLAVLHDSKVSLQLLEIYFHSFLQVNLHPCISTQVRTNWCLYAMPWTLVEMQAVLDVCVLVLLKSIKAIFQSVCISTSNQLGWCLVNEHAAAAVTGLPSANLLLHAQLQP